MSTFSTAQQKNALHCVYQTFCCTNLTVLPKSAVALLKFLVGQMGTIKPIDSYQKLLLVLNGTFCLTLELIRFVDVLLKIGVHKCIWSQAWMDSWEPVGTVELIKF